MAWGEMEEVDQFLYLFSEILNIGEWKSLRRDLVGLPWTSVDLVLGLKINLRKWEIFPVGAIDNIDVLTQLLHCRVGVLPTNLELLLCASTGIRLSRG
ncbi:hypothetical protein KY289_030891 [Solanum tuberosum]|nr:hypothetical protein KY289_030891 [Solanum tuberosum]